MIGAGIFVLSGHVAGMAGPAALYSYMIAGGAVLLTALCFAELSTGIHGSGGPYAFVSEAFNRFLGFVTGWSLWIGLATDAAFYSVGSSRYVAYFMPSWPSNWVVLAIAFLVIWANLGGPGEAAHLQSAVVIVLLAVLGLYLAKGLVGIDRDLHDPFLPYGWPPVFRAATVVFVSFLGFEAVSTVAEEVKNPRTILPLAIVASVVLVTLLYCLIVYVATGTLSYIDLAASPTPIADSAEIRMGDVGGNLIAFAGLLATLSSANASVLASSRIAYAMSRDDLMGRRLGRVDPRTGTPRNAIVATAMIMLLVVLFRHPFPEAAGFLHLFPFLLVPLALLRLRFRRAYRPSFRLPGGLLLAGLAAVANLFLVLQVRPADAALGILLILPGVAYYIIRSKA